ncbi:MAG: alpha-L-rhamnosidase C-terminal domain-containing protein, partial [Candidatus Hydrogenedentota bacterium]
DGMKRYLGWLQEYADGHVVDVGLGDWGGAPLTDADLETAITSTGYYYRFARVLENTAALLGMEGEATEWAELAEEIREVFNAEFLDEERGYYRTGEHEEYLQTSNIFPLAFGMVPEAHEDEVVENLVHDIMETHGGHLNTATLGTKYLLTTLTEHGHHEVAYTIATQTDFPSWGHWIVNNRTSLLEFWGLDARSWDHHFLGVTDEWFYKHLAGIQPGAPGFEHVTIAPKPVGDLDSAHGRVDTVRGIVESGWQLTDDGIRLDVTVPGNTTATIEIPALGHESVQLQESGETIWSGGEEADELPAGIESVSRQDNRLIVGTGGGAFAFELQPAG